MRTGRAHAVVAWTIVLLGVFVPAVVKSQMPLQMPPAEGKLPEDFYVIPSLSVGELYDDNLFFAPSSQRQDDFFTRLRPGILGGYHSTPLTLMGGYTFDSEIYSKHKELTTAQMRQQGSIELKSKAASWLSFSARGDYFQTRTPFELNTLTGFAIRRVLSERYSANPTLEYRYDPFTTVKGDYLYSKDMIEGGITIDSNIARLDLDRRITAHDTVGPGYVGRFFAFAGFGSTSVQALTLGWSRDLTAHTKLKLRAGPRLIEGSLDSQPEALASILYKLEGGELSFTYLNSVTTVIGQPGVARTQSFGISGSYEPLDHLRFSIVPTFFKVTSQTFNSTVYVVNFEGTYQMTKALALKGSHMFSFQQGDFNPLTGPSVSNVETPRNLVWLQLVYTYPSRVD